MEPRRATGLYAALTLLLGVWLYGFQIHEHGRTLDDAVQRARGEATLRYVTTLDRAHLPGDDLEDFARGDRLYGPLGATVAVALGRVLGPLVGDPAVEKHVEFASGLTAWFLLLFYCVLSLGRRVLGSTLGGVAAGLALVAMPRVLGLATCNPSDLPAAAAASLAVLALLRWSEHPSWPRAVAFTAALAAAAAVRAQNGSFLIVVALAFLLPWWKGRDGARSVTPQVLAAPVLAYGFWILFWPDFWHAPLDGPIDVVRGFLAQGQRYTQGTLWFGEPAFGPRLYPFVWLAITTPLWLLAPAAAGAWALRKSPLLAGLLVWLALSLGKHLSGLGNFGGIRHFLDGFVPLAIFAAAGGRWLLGWLHGKTAESVTVAGLAAAAVWAASLCPFESLYFNVLAGGPRGAAGCFDMEPNGASMLPLMRAFQRHGLPERSVILVPGPADLVKQIALPDGVLVHEVRADNVDLLQSEAGKRLIAGRPVFVVTVQDRQWGLFDRFLDDGLLARAVTFGPDGLPVGLVLRVEDDAFYRRVGEVFR